MLIWYYSGIPFNIIQLLCFYLHFLSIKKKDKKYSAFIGWIYFISVVLEIVHYDAITYVLFIIQIFIFLVYPLKFNFQD